MFICTKQRTTTSLFLFVNKQLCYSRKNKNFLMCNSGGFIWKLKTQNMRIFYDHLLRFLNNTIRNKNSIFTLLRLWTNLKLYNDPNNTSLLDYYNIYVYTLILKVEASITDGCLQPCGKLACHCRDKCPPLSVYSLMDKQ